MAYAGDTQTNIWNAVHGARVTGQSIYEISSTAKAGIGTRLVLGDRVFRYAKNGGVALGAAYVCQAPVPEGTYSIGQALGTHAVGETSVTWTVNAGGVAFTKDQFKDGYLLIDDAGSTAEEEGYCYKIKSNTAAGAAADSTIYLYDRLAKAITATATGAIALNPYNGALIQAGSAHLIGVPLVEVTISYYCWLQTWGPCPVVCDGTGINAAGIAVTATAGESDMRDADTEPIIGYSMNIGGANDVSMIYLTIAP